MSFKGATHACLLKMSITHNKYWVSALWLLINCTSARSAPQMLFSKEEYTLRLNFIITVLCNCTANCWFSKLIPLPGWVQFDKQQTICKPLKQVYIGIFHILDI